MSVSPDGRSLVGRTVRLDRATDDDAEALFAALDDDRVWEMGYSASLPRPESAEEWRRRIQLAVEEGRVMYIVRLIDRDSAASDCVVGTTSLADIELDREAAHIGWTAYAPDVWGTSVNPECKLLLLAHCFEDCGLGRVKLQTDIINVRSQAAIAKLGATREGVTRRHFKRADGTWRDSVIFSVIIDDWARVQAGLEARLAGLPK